MRSEPQALQNVIAGGAGIAMRGIVSDGSCGIAKRSERVVDDRERAVDVGIRVCSRREEEALLGRLDFYFT